MFLLFVSLFLNLYYYFCSSAFFYFLVVFLIFDQNLVFRRKSFKNKENTSFLKDFEGFWRTFGISVILKDFEGNCLIFKDFRIFKNFTEFWKHFAGFGKQIPANLGHLLKGFAGCLKQIPADLGHSFWILQDLSGFFWIFEDSPLFLEWQGLDPYEMRLASSRDMIWGSQHRLDRSSPWLMFGPLWYTIRP